MREMYPRARGVPHHRVGPIAIGGRGRVQGLCQLFPGFNARVVYCSLDEGVVPRAIAKEPPPPPPPFPGVQMLVGCGAPFRHGTQGIVPGCVLVCSC